MVPTLFPLNRLSLIIAAKTVALEGSIIIFVLSKKSFVAWIIYNSLTRMISSMFYDITLKVLSPRLVRNPSAMDFGGN